MLPESSEVSLFKKLNAENFLFYAGKYYSDTQAIDMDDFQQDLETFKYIKKIFKRYTNTGVMRERLVVNHIIMLSNVFGIFPTIRMLFYKVHPQHHNLLKTFLIYLKYLTPHHTYYLFKYDGININDVEIDKSLMIRLLRNEYDDIEQESPEDDESY